MTETGISITDAGVIAGFYFGTGIGNAICIDGIPLLGHNGVAGELGISQWMAAIFLVAAAI